MVRRLSATLLALLGLIGVLGCGSSGSSSGPGGGGASGGSGGSGAGGGSGAAGGTRAQPPPDPCIVAGSCPAGVWVNVSPPGEEIPEFGFGPVVPDPDLPSALYMSGGGDGLWKSADYGNSWNKINADIPYAPMGYVLAVLPGTPKKLIAAGYKQNYVSIDGGQTFDEVPIDLEDSLYSLQVDPYDGTHLLSGIHEQDGIVESTDGGQTWSRVGTAGFPGGGISWFAFFLDTGDAQTTRATWLAIAQNGASVIRTSDGGKTWTTPQGIAGLNHAHGNAQIFQSGQSVWVPGTGGPGDGLYKSTDLGLTFTRVLEGGLSVAWGTKKNVYAMWGWACSGCDLGASFAVAPLPEGDTFTKPEVPAELVIGSNHMVVTSDGQHDIFVGTMWSTGVWRYVEP
jgi:photosystem II stability/assembly factor-like uncharacterized protein